MAKVQNVSVFRSLKIGAWVLFGIWRLEIGASPSVLASWCFICVVRRLLSPPEYRWPPPQ
jgi:hypothetical protein